jgi:hypothetical protein
MPSPDYDPNAGGPTTGENKSGGENTPESLPDREDRRRQEDTLWQRSAPRWEERSRGEEGGGQSPTGGPIPAVIEARFAWALSGDALRVGLPVSEAHAPERSEAATGRVPTVVYLWGIQAPRPGQPFGTAATEAAGRICGGKRLRVAAQRAGLPEASWPRGKKQAEGRTWAGPSSAGGWRGRTSGGLPPPSYEAWSRRPAGRRWGSGSEQTRFRPGPGGSETRWEKPS